MMNTSDERITGLSDEALDPPMRNALIVTVTAGCNCGWCEVSDEALDQAPAQEAYVGCRVCVLCTISDEALDAR